MTSVIIRIPTTGFRILCQWNFGIPDCNNWGDSGFLKLYSGFQSPGARSLRPKFPEISVQNSMDRFGPTRKVSKKLVYLLRWNRFPVGPVGILVKWIAPLDFRFHREKFFEFRAPQAKTSQFPESEFPYMGR